MTADEGDGASGAQSLLFCPWVQDWEACRGNNELRVNEGTKGRKRVQGSRRGKGWGGLGLRLGLGLGLGGQQKHPAQQRPGVPNLLPLPQSQLIKKTWAAVRAEAPASARGFGAGRPREM